MKKFLLFTFFILFTKLSFGQTTLLLEDFEDATINYTLSHPEASDGAADYWIRTDVGSISASFTNIQGTSFFGAQHITANGMNDPNISGGVGTMTISNIDITNYSDLELSFFIAEDDFGSSQSWDDDTQFKIEYSLDNGAFSEIFRVEAAGGTNTEPREDTNFDGTGDGTPITDTFQEFKKNISGTGGELDLVITFSNLNAGEEDIAIDHIKVTGLVAGTVAVGFENSSSSVAEGNSGSATHQVNVVMNNAPVSNVTVEVTDAGTGTATAGAANDYEFTTTNLVFTPGESYPATKPVDVTINGDTEVENDETVDLSLAVTAGTATTLTTAHTVTINNDDVYELVINEILADPNSDANGDASVNNDDEFVEFINNSGSNLDISGLTLSDAGSVRHTFPANTVVPANFSIVVFGGGTPTGIPGLVQTASSGGLSLNNSSETITLKNGGITLVEYTYGSEANDNQSIARDPDITGSFVKHLTISSNMVEFSPGRDNTDNSPLPIELISFDARLNEEQVLLSWSTSAEINNDYFSLEHSLDGNSFKELTQIVGEGTTYDFHQYQYIHQNPAIGSNYYRLKQVDLDGSFLYSSVINVVYNNMNNGGGVRIYPNPVQGDLINVIIPQIEESAKISLFQTNGRVVRQLENAYSQSKFDVSDLEKGFYLVKVEMNGRVVWERFVIQ